MNSVHRFISGFIGIAVLSLFSRGSISVWWRNFDVWKKNYAASLTGNLGEPVLFLLAMGFGLGALVVPIEGMSYIEFIAPGLVGSATMYGASFECTFGSYTRIAVQKTYDLIRVTPVSIEEVTGGDILWGATKGMIAGFFFLLVMLVFGLIKSWGVVFLPALMMILAIAFASLAILFSSKAPSYNFFSYYFTLIIAPMFLFSGIFFPIDTFPAILQSLVWFTPLYHFVILSRGLILGNFDLSMFGDIFWLLIFTFTLFFVAVRSVKKRVVM